MSTILRQLNEEMACLIKRVGYSLVRVGDGHGSCASGTVWHPEGLILTNSHAVSHERIDVTLADGRTLKGRLIGRDKTRDLAALIIDAKDLPAIELGDSSGLEPGQFVMALGHPQGITGAATAGVFMGASDEHLRISLTQNFLAVNLLLRPGSSGGPLVDAEGKLVGINTIMTGPVTGLAIPVNAAKTFLRDTAGDIVHRSLQ